MERDIFEDRSIDWAQMRKKIIGERSSFAQKLEKFAILEVPSQIVSEVADIAATSKMSTKVEWIGKILVEIATKENILVCFKSLEV